MKRVCCFGVIIYSFKGVSVKNLNRWIAVLRVLG